MLSFKEWLVQEAEDSLHNLLTEYCVVNGLTGTYFNDFYKFMSYEFDDSDIYLFEEIIKLVVESGVTPQLIKNKHICTFIDGKIIVLSLNDFINEYDSLLEGLAGWIISRNKSGLYSAYTDYWKKERTNGIY